MYIRYTKLWKQLIDRGMQKTDLIEATGISSRTLAKLSKNESVTTDTLLQICSVLHCDIGDIAEVCEGEERLSLYEAYKKHAKIIQKDEVCTTLAFSFYNKNVLVRRTNTGANKHTFIHCGDNGSVLWERLYPVGHPGGFVSDKKVLATAAFWKKDTICILLISGKPGSIDHLDEGWFVSSRATPKSEKYIYVMSQAAFKQFVPAEFR